MFKIVTVPHPILRTPCKPVVVVDERIKKICAEMAETLEGLSDPKGVGLAANQVGIGLSLFVFRHGKKIRSIINPKIAWKGDNLTYDRRGKTAMLEGCLSIPHYYGLVKRYEKIRLSYLDLNNKTSEEEFGLPESIIVQHETEHLQGRLFVDLLLEQKGKLYKVNKGDQKKEMVEVDI